MRRPFVVLYALLTITFTAAAQTVKTPDQLYGPLFRDVQLSAIFEDSKTFVDCIPKTTPDSIVAAYQALLRNNPRPDLRAFVEQYFDLPAAAAVPMPAPDTLVTTHIRRLWQALYRAPGPEQPYSSLLRLPYPYVVPGGRFREIYYWDSYFTMLGLEESGRIDIIANMVRNFAWLIHTYGHIPNGNRSYFLSRSQPPFFALMVDLLARRRGDSIYTAFLPALEKEYAYWMDRSAPARHVVQMPDGSLLNRYYDELNIPRQEACKEDWQLARDHPQDTQLCRQLRAAAESGWDFSSRWFRDRKTLATIHTMDFVPVDLNCLLYHLERTLAKALAITHHKEEATRYNQLAAKRRKSILQYCWSAKAGWFVDYDLQAGRPSTVPTLAGMYPFFLRVAGKEQLAPVHKKILSAFLQPGGVVTTLENTGQQWDFPNGWAPLEWVTIAGLENYGDSKLAATIASRWIRLNTRVYRNTGKLLEKYNVVDTHLTAGGGEYPTQDGFGWTNGVLLKLISMYKTVPVP